MREPTIARNYAETLIALARESGDLGGWGGMLTEVVEAVQQNERLRLFIQSPRVSPEEKNAIIGRAFGDRLPILLVRFLQAVITHRRQAILPAIQMEYLHLVDEIEGRVHASVVVARPPSEETQGAVVRQLTRLLGKTVVPHFVVRPEILGGAIVRVGDTVMDGSARRKLLVLRSRMLACATSAPV